MRLRDTRRFKTKGALVSFGDIMLPLVGLVAIGLLLVAGELFFFSDVQTDKRPVPVIAPLPPPVQERQAEAEAREQPQNVPAPPAHVSVFDRPHAETTPEKPAEIKPLAFLNVLAVPYGGKTESAPAAQSAPPSVSVVQPEKKPAGQKPPPSPAAPAPSRPQPEKAVPPKKQTPPVVQTTRKSAGWMVQVGAFSTKEAAEAVTQQLTQANYATTLLSGKTLYRVLVQAGSTRDEALAQATKLAKIGFQGAFIVPPRP